MAMELTWLGQGGFLIRCGGSVICLDPYLSYSCEESGGHTRIAPPPLDPASITADPFVCSHDHMYHLDEGTLRRIDLADTLFAGPASCRSHLLRLGVDAENLLAFDRGDKLCVGDAELYAVHAEHTEDSIGLVVRGGGCTVYFTADTLYSPLLAESARPFAPDAWIDESKTKIGYEIPFTRYFYKYEAPRSSSEIMAEIMDLQAELEGSLEEIFDV